MKKLLLISIILALGSAATLSAQTYSITMSITNPDHGIIRQNNIAYVEESVGSGWFVYFSSLTPGTPSSRVKVPEGWSIKDFHIIDILQTCLPTLPTPSTPTPRGKMCLIK